MIYRHRIRVALVLVLLVLIGLLIAPVESDQPTPPSPHDRLMADLNANRPVQALYQVEAIANQSGWTGDLARIAGNIWQQLGDIPRAAAFWELAAKDSPINLALAKQIAQTDLDLQRWSAAVVALNHVVELSADDNWAHYQLGLLQAAYDPQRALSELRLAARDSEYRAVASDFLFLAQAESGDPGVVMHVGLVLASHQMWGYAESVFQYAAVLAPPFPEALAYAGLARDNQGKDGSSQITQAVTAAPFNAQVRYLQGLHLRLTGDTTASLDAFQQAVNLNPVNPAFAAELGAAYQRVDNLKQAESWLKQAVTLSNNDQRFQDLLTQFYQQFPSLGQ